MNLKINNKEYQIVNKIDMTNIPHIGQHLIALWVLDNKRAFNLFIWEDYSWSIYDRQNQLVCEGKGFIEFLKETEQYSLWRNGLNGEKKDEQSGRNEQSNRSNEKNCR